MNDHTVAELISRMSVIDGKLAIIQATTDRLSASHIKDLTRMRMLEEKLKVSEERIIDLEKKCFVSKI